MCSCWNTVLYNGVCLVSFRDKKHWVGVGKRSDFGHKHSLKYPNTSLKNTNDRTARQIYPEIPQYLLKNIQWFHLESQPCCYSTSIPLLLLRWIPAHIHVMWLWYDTYCGNVSMVRITRTNLNTHVFNTSVVCRKMKRQHFYRGDLTKFTLQIFFRVLGQQSQNRLWLQML